MLRHLALIFFIISLSSCSGRFEKKGRKVEIVSEDGEYILLKDGEPFYIKGAGGYDNFEKIKLYGGNSVRVWDHYNAGEVLNEAHKYGLNVMLGLDLGKEINGFNYDDEEAVRKQFNRIKDVVRRYKDHPALLFWVVGNEVDQYGKNDKVWSAVNDISEMIHEEDPEHPVTTTIVPGRLKILKVKVLCPNLDFLSFNTFNHLTELPSKLKEPVWGYDGPYVVAEWGSEGWWEVERCSWGAPMEKSSTEKAKFFGSLYQYIKKDKKCIGSYTFYWGAKQERTPTWFSLFSFDNHETEAVQVIKSLWTGNPVADTFPSILSLQVDGKYTGKNLFFSPLSSFSLKVNTQAVPAISKTIIEVRKEAPDYPQPWEVEEVPELVSDTVLVNQKGEIVKMQTPASPGPYRIYVYVSDSLGRIATANFPFFVK